MTDINPISGLDEPTFPAPSLGGESDSTSHIDPKQAASAAASETSAVAHSAVGAGKDVAHEAASQAANVATQAKDQIGNVVNQARGELKAQADTRTEQAAAGLQTFAEQLGALSEGRPADAGHVGALVSDAQQRVSAYAQTLQDRGPQALLEDLTTFARRRPLVFLFSAGVAGFAAGRIARATAAAHKDADGDDTGAQGSIGLGAYGSSADPQETIAMIAPVNETSVAYGSSLS